MKEMLITNKYRFFAIFIVASIFVLYLTYGKTEEFYTTRQGIQIKNLVFSEVLKIKPEETTTTTTKKVFAAKDFSRDFYRYTCQNRLRVGGPAEYLAKVPDKLYRTEG